MQIVFEKKWLLQNAPKIISWCFVFSNLACIICLLHLFEEGKPLISKSLTSRSRVYCVFETWPYIMHCKSSVWYLDPRLPCLHFITSGSLQAPKQTLPRTHQSLLQWIKCRPFRPQLTCILNSDTDKASSHLLQKENVLFH